MALTLSSGLSLFFLILIFCFMFCDHACLCTMLYNAQKRKEETGVTDVCGC